MHLPTPPFLDCLGEGDSRAREGLQSSEVTQRWPGRSHGCACLLNLIMFSPDLSLVSPVENSPGWEVTLANEEGPSLGEQHSVQDEKAPLPRD